MLESQMGDRGGAQEEPYMSVQSAHVQSGNPRTGNGPSRLAFPATVSETPTHISLKAEDAPYPGRGLNKDENNPPGSLTIQEEDSLDAQPDKSASEDKSHIDSSEEEDTDETQINPIKSTK